MMGRPDDVSKLQSRGYLNTMKNTARRVGAPRGAGGRAVRPPHEAQGRSPEHDGGYPRAPRGTNNVAQVAGTRGEAAGGKPREAASEGKPLQTRTAAQGASRQKRERSDYRCAERSESPAGACPLARGSLPAQEPDKGNDAQRRKARTTEETTAHRRDGRPCKGLWSRRTYEKKASQQ